MVKSSIGTPPLANEQNHTNQYKSKTCNNMYIEQGQDYTKTTENNKDIKTAYENK